MAIYNRKTDREKAVEKIGYLALQSVVNCTDFISNDLVFDIQDYEKSPERSIWIRHYHTTPAILLLFTRETGKTRVILEYAMGEDGHFAEEEFTTIQDACKAFQFAIKVIEDIRKQIDAVL